MAPNNTLPTWGNASSMNLNSLILTNIQSSPYFKNELIKLKTYHEVIDEIYYRVDHLEPWERGSRQTSGQIGMCGGVRGVGAGGIVSSAYCLLFKLYTLKLTRKQIMGILNHTDSPFIRCLGFMFIRYTQPPQDLFDWFEPYFEDEEEVDPKAGGGTPTTIGQVVQGMLTKQDWYSTLFPRIPVPVAKEIERKFTIRKKLHPELAQKEPEQTKEGSRKASPAAVRANNGERSSSRSNSERKGSLDRDGSSKSRDRRSRSMERGSKSRDGGSKSRDGKSSSRGSRSQDRISSSRDRRDAGSRSGDRGKQDRSRDRGRDVRPRSRERRYSPPRRRDEGDRYRRRSPPRERKDQKPQSRSTEKAQRGSEVDFADELRRERERQKRESRRSRSRDRGRRSQSR